MWSANGALAVCLAVVMARLYLGALLAFLRRREGGGEGREGRCGWEGKRGERGG